MPASKVVGIDHISIRVSDYEKSKAFYAKLFEFLGFEISDEYPSTIGWTNGKTRYWIAPRRGPEEVQDRRCRPAPLRLPTAQPPRRRCPAGLPREGEVRIVDPADEYYEDYYAVFFLDPDGIKLEGMKYGELTAKRRSASL